MNVELCSKCVQSQYADEHVDSVCEVCYQIDNIGNGSNAYFVEKIDVPNNCGECKYCKKDEINIFINNKEYCTASKTFDKDERIITMQFIRKNYLTRNTPKWCPMKVHDEKVNQ